MKLDYISMLTHIGEDVYFGRMDGLVAIVPSSDNPGPLFQIDQFEPLSMATDDSEIAVSGFIGEQGCVISKTDSGREPRRYEGNLRFFVSPEYAVDEDFNLCHRDAEGYKPFMSLALLDSEPLAYSVSTDGGPFLAIARYGTIYTIDCNKARSCYPLTFAMGESEIIDKMNEILNEKYNKRESQSNGAAEVGIVYSDPDEDSEMLEQNQIFDSLIDSSFPLKAHNPSCHISLVKLIGRSSLPAAVRESLAGISPLVVSASADHHIAVHDFLTHERIFDSGWLESFALCCAQSAGRLFFGCRSGRIITLDLDGLILKEYHLPVECSLLFADICDSRMALYTSDNTVLIVDCDTLEIEDVFTCENRLSAMCLSKRGLFMLDTELTLTNEVL